MQKTSLTIRVDADDLERWKQQSGGNLSEWIRERCNDEMPAPNKRRGSGRKVDCLPDMAGRSSGSDDSGLAPRHTAESNWRTCLCGTCVKKRKDRL